MSKILVERGADPWVTQVDGSYYYCHNNPEYTGIFVATSAQLQDIGKVPTQQVWYGDTEPDCGQQIWAPEQHHIDEAWYIYFAGTATRNEDHRMYVLGTTTDDPLADYIYRGQIGTADDHWAIDGTVLETSDGRFFVWSGWEGDENVQQNLYIAEMDSPTSVTGERVCISEPEYEWEIPMVAYASATGLEYPAVNEGPQVLANDNQTFIVYSANGSWTDDYCLGLLTLKGDDPLDATSWQKQPKPVFKKTKSIYGPGHASFVKDGDGSDWIVYHTARHAGAGWDRQVRSKQFYWHTDGMPIFGQPE